MGIARGFHHLSDHPQRIERSDGRAEPKACIEQAPHRNVIHAVPPPQERRQRLYAVAYALERVQRSAIKPRLSPCAKPLLLRDRDFLVLSIAAFRAVVFEWACCTNACVKTSRTRAALFVHSCSVWRMTRGALEDAPVFVVFKLFNQRINRFAA